MKKYGIVSHAELESEHYNLVRNNPLYRQYLRQTYHEVEHEPSNASLFPDEAATTRTLYSERERQLSVPKTATTSNDLTQVKSLLLNLQNRLNKHIDITKKKRIPTSGKI